MTEGYVYAWRVPIEFEAGLGGGKKRFCIVKVGKSGGPLVLQRLRTERTAWRKLMAQKNPGTGRYRYDACPDIPFGTPESASRLLLGDQPSWESMRAHYKSELPDLCLLLHCKTGLSDMETTVRSFLGSPLPADILKTAIQTYNKIGRAHRPTEGCIQQSQVAPTEYCLVETSLFSQTRERFINLCSGTSPLGSIPMEDIANLLTARRAEKARFCNLDLSSFLHMPQKYEAPKVIVRYQTSKGRKDAESDGRKNPV